jgi:hypothetical protein
MDDPTERTMDDFIDKFIERLDPRNSPIYLTREEMLERNKAIAIAVLKGSTLDKVACDFDLSGNRVRQILLRLSWIARKKVLGDKLENDTEPLKPRTIKTLRANASCYIDAITKIKTADYYKRPSMGWTAQS